MRITSKQLAELGINHVRGDAYKRGQGMNKTEERYYDECIYPRLITGEYVWSAYEKIRLRVGKGNAFFNCDFAVVTKDGKLEFAEVKGGHTREASLVRLKAAAEQFPFVFRLCRYVGGDWSIVTI